MQRSDRKLVEPREEKRCRQRLKETPMPDWTLTCSGCNQVLPLQDWAVQPQQALQLTPQLTDVLGAIITHCLPRQTDANNN